MAETRNGFAETTNAVIDNGLYDDGSDPMRVSIVVLSVVTVSN